MRSRPSTPRFIGKAIGISSRSYPGLSFWAAPQNTQRFSSMASPSFCGSLSATSASHFLPP
eukprot:2708653-Pyramimonas_sp.AAC.1